VGAPDEEARVAALPSTAEREILHTVSALRRGDGAAGVDALDRAFTASRNEPWAREELLREALDMASSIAEREPRFARRLVDILKQPLAVDRLRESREIAALRAAIVTRDPQLCVEALAPLEPPPLDERVLSARAACYTKTGHALVQQAVRDLAAFRGANTGFDEVLAPR
jgi:hypothetical protein